MRVLALTLATLFAFLINSANATIFVPDDYEKIQVKNASNGDEIIVRDGVYEENVDKSVYLHSENGIALLRAYSGDIFNVTDSVTLRFWVIPGISWTGAAGMELDSNFNRVANKRFKPWSDTTLWEGVIGEVLVSAGFGVANPSSEG